MRRARMHPFATPLHLCILFCAGAGHVVPHGAGPVVSHGAGRVVPHGAGPVVPHALCILCMLF